MKNKRKKVVTLYLIRLHWELKMLSFGNTNTRRTGSKKKPDDLSQFKPIRCAKSFHFACCSECPICPKQILKQRECNISRPPAARELVFPVAIGILLYLL